ncbi:hypothetical protein CAPTEDRAFT_201969 [Capitella teleta]|uniref:Uncharacterized protein n=1 Tax=Capitella teleta TaxID=283909 RepID=R7UTR6_CAPTE|nr:hypothetical protein CAPTEDRAFT_201969 [Capitella teleta]|eukprot:ELU09919.1 hypothetical protein CAPTEDRAFT_201969 [Capitella teleta]
MKKRHSQRTRGVILGLGWNNLNTAPRYLVIMFARAGISGRILRSGRDGTAPVSLHPFLARPKKKQKTKCYCYVPVVWQAIVAVMCGILALMAGTAMCTFGYYAIPLPTSAPRNETEDGEDEKVPNLNGEEYGHLHNLAYVGPVLMGMGCFVIVVSCVHVCEVRDQKIKEFEERRRAEEAKRGGKKLAKQRVYDRIMKQLRARLAKDKASSKVDKTAKEEPAEACASESAVEKAIHAKNSHRELLKGLLRRCSALSMVSTRSDYSNISLALKTIPTEIFTVDMEGKNDTSLHPVRIISPKRRSSLALATKFPSDPCLSRTRKRASRSLAQSSRSRRRACAADKEADSSVDKLHLNYLAGGDHHATVRAASDPSSTTSTVIVHHASVHYESERPTASRSAWSHDVVNSTPEPLGSPRTNEEQSTSTAECLADQETDHKTVKTDNAKQITLMKSSAHNSRRATIPNGITSSHKTAGRGPLISLPRVEISVRASISPETKVCDESARLFKYATTPQLYTNDMQQFHNA